LEAVEVPHPFEFWSPNYSDVTLAIKLDGRPRNDSEGYEVCLKCLGVHTEKGHRPLWLCIEIPPMLLRYSYHLFSESEGRF